MFYSLCPTCYKTQCICNTITISDSSSSLESTAYKCGYCYSPMSSKYKYDCGCVSDYNVNMCGIKVLNDNSVILMVDTPQYSVCNYCNAMYFFGTNHVCPTTPQLNPDKLEEIIQRLDRLEKALFEHKCSGCIKCY